MHPLEEHLRNPLRSEQDRRDRGRLQTQFPDLAHAPGPHFLALRNYLDSRPQRFFDRDAFRLLRDWLWAREKSDHMGLQAYLRDNDPELSLALLHLREINNQDWHDEPLTSGDEFDLVRLVERKVHPGYLRLVEGVFDPLLRLVAYFSRLDRNKGTDGLNLHSVVQEIDRSAMRPLARLYQHTIRNGIAHGGITYLQNHIRYRDSRGKETTVATGSVVEMFDNLLDTCNGMTAALKLFFSVHRESGFLAPRELLIEELQEETRTRWWKIEGCVTGEAGQRSQLTLFARPHSRDIFKVQWSAFQSGVLAEYFAPGFDRYLLSLQSPKAWRGWAALDGNRLRTLREAGSEHLENYRGVIEDGAVFYFPQPAPLPRALGRIDTLFTSLKMHWPLAMDELRDRLGVPRILIRSAHAHRNAWGCVVNGNVVLENLPAGDLVETIRRHRRRILRAAVKVAKGGILHNPAAYLPIGFAQIAVFRRDHRRRLSNFGLGPDLVCTVRFQRLSRIQSPDILPSTVEQDGRWRIAWNRAWLEDTGVSTK